MKKTFAKIKKLISLFAVMTILAVQVAPVAGAVNFTGQNFQSVSAGSFHTAVLLADGTVKTFGSNSYGQLGDSSTNSAAASPVTVSGVDNIGTLNNAVAVSAGALHTAVILDDGTVKTFDATPDDGKFGLLGLYNVLAFLPP